MFISKKRYERELERAAMEARKEVWNENRYDELFDKVEKLENEVEKLKSNKD